MLDKESIQNHVQAIANSTGMAERNKLFYELDEVVNLRYELPPEAGQIWGLHQVTTPSPFVNLQIAINALSQTMPAVHIDPLRGDQANREVANKRELWAKWTLTKLINRKGGNVLQDILESAFRYGMVCFRTDHLEYASKARASKTGKAEKRHSQRHGPFSWKVLNPACVYPSFTDDGLYSLATIEVKEAHEVVHYWGSAAKELERKLKGKSKDATWEFNYVVEICYTDMDTVFYGAIPHMTATFSPASIGTDWVVLHHVANDLGFIPYVCETRASALEPEGRGRYKAALNWANAQTGWHLTRNLAATMLVTQGVQNAGRPHFKENNSTGDSKTEVDYTNLAGGVMRVPPGKEIVEIQPRSLDAGLMNILQMMENFEGETGVSHALAGGTGAGDESYARYNARVLTGQVSIGPGIELAERAIAEGLLHNFMWMMVAEDEYSFEESMKGTLVHMGKPMMGYEEEYYLAKDTLEPDDLYITVELKQGQTGGIQAANAAAIAKQFGQSDATSLEQFGNENPEQEIERTFAEQLQRARVENQLMIERAQAEIEVQMMQAQAQQAIQQMQAQQQGPPAPPMGGNPTFPGMDTNPVYSDQMPMQATPPTGNPGGQGYNSAAGGIPPALLNPVATLEGQMGMARDGNPSAI